MSLLLSPVYHRIHLQRNGAPISLAPSLEHLLALLDGVAAAQDGDLPTVPSGSAAEVLAESDTASLVSVRIDQWASVIGWIPSRWISQANEL